MSLTEYRVGDKAIWNAGREYEQERIIKLLEKNDDGTGWIEIRLDKLIALIKGESNG